MESKLAASPAGQTHVEGGRQTATAAGQLPRFITVSEASVLLRVSKRTIYDWVSRERIPFRKAGRITIFDRDEIIEWTKVTPAERA